MEHNELSLPIQSALVFAARYAYDRQTGGAYAVVGALKACWNQLSVNIQEQILKESTAATYNQDDWEHLAKFAKNAGNQFYILSLKHSPEKGFAVWWGKENSGYYTSLESAGKYSASDVGKKSEYYNDCVDTLAISCKKVEALTLKTVDWHAVRPKNAKV